MNTVYDSVSPNEVTFVLLDTHEIDAICGGTDPVGFIVSPRT